MSMDHLIEQVLNESSNTIVNTIKNQLNKAHIKYSIHEEAKNEGQLVVFIIGPNSDKITIKAWIHPEKGCKFYYDAFYNQINKYVDSEQELITFVGKNMDLIVRSILNIMEFRELKETFNKIR